MKAKTVIVICLFLLSILGSVNRHFTVGAQIENVSPLWSYAFPANRVIAQAVITETAIYVSSYDTHSVYISAFDFSGHLLWEREVAYSTETIQDEQGITLFHTSPYGRYIVWPLGIYTANGYKEVGTYVISYNGELVSSSEFDESVSGITDDGQVIRGGLVFGNRNTIVNISNGEIIFKDTYGNVIQHYRIDENSDYDYSYFVFVMGNYLLIEVVKPCTDIFFGTSGSVFIETNQTPIITDVYLFDDYGKMLYHSNEILGIVYAAGIHGYNLTMLVAYSSALKNKKIYTNLKWIDLYDRELYVINIRSGSMKTFNDGEYNYLLGTLVYPTNNFAVLSPYMGVTGMNWILAIDLLTGRSYQIDIGGYVYWVTHNYSLVSNDSSIYLYSTSDTVLGTFKISSSPPGARIYINGNYKEVTPLTLKLEPGNYTIKLTKKDYEVYTKTVEIKPCETTTLSVTLTPKFGFLTVTSEPSGAKVYIDGSYVGTTPLENYKLFTGEHEVKVEKSGFHSFVKSVTIKPGETTTVRTTLTLLLGTLKITSQPSEAEVYINGTYKGVTPLTLELKPGSYTIKLTLNGYQDYTTIVTLSPGETKSLSATLKPVYGYLTVYSSPSGADVYIDGSYVGKTPLEDYKLLPGEHTVKITMEGYRDFTKTVTVPSGERETLSASLVPLYSSTSSTASTTTMTTTTSTASETVSPVQVSSGSGFNLLYIVALIGLVLVGGVAAKVRGGKPKPSPPTKSIPTPAPVEKSAPARKAESRPAPPRHVPGFPAELLEKYEPLEFLGEGGFAKVFKVRRRSDGKTIALKVSRLDEKAKRFFLKEVKAWRLLDHENIVKLYNAFDEPLPHLEIEFVDGIKLDGEVIRDLGKYPKPVEEGKALHFIKGIARGLAHAHSKQVYHRDLKPQNVLITSDLTPKITDWGLAKVGAVSTTATTTKGLTLLYAAPEQLDDETYGHTDQRTDIYQLGLIFYELLTGKLPYTGTSPAVVMAKVINPAVKPKPPSHYNRALAKYDGLFEKLLAKRKEDRYESVEEFLNDLELMKRLDEERRKLQGEIEKTKTTMSMTTDSKELKKLMRQLVEKLSRNALLHAQLNDKAGLINALEDLKAFSKEHRGELESAIAQFELMMRESVPISKSTLDELRVLLHKVQREVENKRG